MKLFSRIAFICNICFVIFITLRYIEFNKKIKGGDNIIPLPFVTGALVILGLFAIFINLIFCLVALKLLVSKKMIPEPKWITTVNFLFLIFQVYYFFIY